MSEPAVRLAVLGAPPAFAAPLRADRSPPDGGAVDRAMRGIFERRYFTNNGPLVHQLDAALARLFGVEHAVCVTNGSSAVTILAKALGLAGEVILPAIAPPGLVEGLRWGGADPVLCDVDRATGTVSAQFAQAMMTRRTRAVFGFHLWGQACELTGLRRAADAYRCALLFDATHAIGCAATGRPLSSFGDAAVFSFAASTMFSGTAGGCIATGDRALADRLRTMRTFQPAETFADVALRTNGKMSEAQAAMALLSLEDLPRTIAANRARFEAYTEHLREVPGVRLLRCERGPEDNFEHVVIDVEPARAGIDRDGLRDALAAENIVCTTPFSPPIAAQGALPAAAHVCSRLLRLPNGQPMSVEDAARIGTLVRHICAHAVEVDAALRRR